jgi:hypothetical protein
MDIDMRELKGAVLTVVMMMILCILLFLTVGCKTIKKSVSEKENVSDSVRIEYKEKVVKVPVTVYVEVPVENVSTMTKDSTSHLETSFAVSNASMVWIDGVPFLRHSLANKAQKIQKNDSVPVVEKEKVVYQTRRVTYTKTEIREKQLSFFQKALMWAGGIGIVSFIIIVIIGLLYWLRR